MSLAVLAAGLLVATIVDVRTRRIPNVLTGTMAGAGLGLAAFGFGGISVGAAVLGCVVGLVLMLPGHALGATGAGDVKLMAAVGTLLGPLGGWWNAVLLHGHCRRRAPQWSSQLQRRRLGTTLAGTGRMIAAPTDVKRGSHRGLPASQVRSMGPAIAAGSHASRRCCGK